MINSSYYLFLITLVSFVLSCNSTDKKTIDLTTVTNTIDTVEQVRGVELETINTVSKEAIIDTIDTIEVMVIPCSNGYEYAMHNYDFNPIIESELNQFKNINVKPFPFKKLIGVPYQGVFDKKYCRPILENVDVDFLILTRFSEKYSRLTGVEKKWGYELRIVKSKTLEQLNSIKATNLSEYKQIESHIKKNIGEVQMDIMKSYNKD